MTENNRDAAEEFAKRLANNDPPDPDPTDNFFLYGETGTGKTTCVKTLKEDVLRTGPDGAKALLLTNDKGGKSIQSALHDDDPYRWLEELVIHRYRDLQDAYVFLNSREHPYVWAILDDTKIMADMLVKKLEGEYGDDVWGIYRALNNKFRKMLRSFRDLDMNILFIGREGKMEDSERRTAAFPGKALGTGNDKSSVLHEFDHAFRAIKRGAGDDAEYLLQTESTEDAEAKKRDEHQLLDLYEKPDLSAIRKKINHGIID